MKTLFLIDEIKQQNNRSDEKGKLKEFIQFKCCGCMLYTLSKWADEAKMSSYRHGKNAEDSGNVFDCLKYHS